MERDLVWDPGQGRYRDAGSGKLLTRLQQTRLRNDLADSFAARFRALTGQVFAGDLADFATAFRALLADAVASGYAFGAGGVLDDLDADRVAAMIARQEPFAAQFAADVETAIRTGRLDWQDRLAARSALYAGQTVEGYERGQARATGRVAAELLGDGADSAGPDLPSYPGDGNQLCGSNCRCRWVILAYEDRWECTWKLNPSAHHCETCKQHARDYDPLIQPVRDMAA